MCLTCKAINQDSRKTVRPLICFRLKLQEMVLNRPPASLRLSQRWDGSRLTNVSDWTSAAKPKKILIMQNICPEPFELMVLEFRPRPGDHIDRVWFDGDVKKVKRLPPYAIANVGKSSHYLHQFVEQQALKAFIQHSLDPNLDTLVARNYKMIIQHIHSPVGIAFL